MTTVNPKIEDSWKKELEAEFQSEYFRDLKQFLQEEKGKGQMVFPPGPLIFNAFNHTPFNAVKVVILGQDPYHGPGQAHGLSFSVPQGVPTPPSLANIFAELKTDIGMEIPSHGNLEKWADQGVLLLNACLTVRAHQAGSHHGKGWEQFTTAAVQKLSQHREGLIFLLWGRPAQEKEPLIDAKKHFILKAPHPSPLSAYRGFMGCRHFSKANALLTKAGKAPVDWRL